MLKPYKDPYGYKKLLAFQKAEQVQICCGEITKCFPKNKTLLSLADQMDRSARSGKQNIVEGWKRNTTKEYYDFLGFSIGAIAELEEDCNDVWKGFYPDLMGLRCVMGEMGLKGAKVEKVEKVEKGTSLKPSNSASFSDSASFSNPLNTLTPFDPLNPPFDIEKLKFYPLDETLPPIVKLKLRCKELNFMLHRLQESLLVKMEQEKTLPMKDKVKIMSNQIKEGDDEYTRILEQMGLETLENGQVVKRGGE